MELRSILMVSYKEHVADERVESVAYPDVKVAVLTGKESLHLALRVNLRAHLIASVVRGQQIFLAHLGGMFLKHTVEHPGDERCCEQFLLPVQSVALYFGGRHAQRRLELTQQSVHRIDGYLPYTEESQHVVYAVSVEELGHVLEPAHPPAAVVFQHFVPVISGEAPVLSVHGEVVWRCSGLPIQVEVARFGPHVAAIAVHADGYVTLQNDAVRLGIVVYGSHLRVEHILHVIPEACFGILFCARCREGFAVFLVPRVVSGPLREVGRSVAVAQTAVLCIRHEPCLSVFEEVVECL